MAIKFDKSKLVKNLAQGNILAPFLDRALETFDEPWVFDYTEKEIDTAWHPSGDCMTSVTDLYEKAMGKEREPISGSLRKSFMVGHFWHQWIQHVVVEKLGFCTPDQIECKGKNVWAWDIEYKECTMNCIGGHSEDCLAWALKSQEPQAYHWVTGQGDMAPMITPRWRGIVDIKTMSSYQFKQSSVPAWAADKYLCQIQIYMDLFDEDQGMILAVNKDAPHDFKEFRYVRDQDLIDAIYAKWHYVSACLDEGVAPMEEDNELYALPIEK